VPFDGAFSPLHWVIVAVVALLVLGAEQLPNVARRAGETMRDLRRIREHLRTELRDLVAEFDLEAGSDSRALQRPDRRETETNGLSASD